MKGIKRYLIPNIVLIFFLTSCVSDSNSFNATADGDNEDEIIEINIAHGNQPSEPIGKIAEKWKELAENRSDGKIKLNLYPSSQLGSERDVVELAQNGNNVVILTAFDYLMNYVPDVGILSAPYLADDIDSIIELTNSDWFADMEEKLNSKGFEIINTNTIYGTRHLMTNSPVESPDDLKGMKIRVPNNALYIKTFSAFGASPTPMPLPDTYTGLQQGLIDGAENPLPVLEGSKTNEVADHLTLTEHMKIVAPWIAGTDFIETLPEDAVEILKQTSVEAAEYGRTLTEKTDEKVLDNFKTQGIEIHEPDLNKFKKEAESVYHSVPEWTDGLYEKVHSLIEEQISKK